MPKSNKVDRDIILKVATYEAGESLFIPCATKKEQQKQFTVFHNLAKKYVSYVDPDIKLTVMKTLQQGKFWIKILNEDANKLLYKRTKDGEVIPTTVK